MSSISTSSKKKVNAIDLTNQRRESKASSKLVGGGNTSNSSRGKYKDSHQLDIKVLKKDIAPEENKEVNNLSKEAKRVIVKQKTMKYVPREQNIQDIIAKGNADVQLIQVRPNLAIELEDPANEYLREDIQKIMYMTNELNTLKGEYCHCNDQKELIQEEVSNLMKNDFNRNNCKLYPLQCKKKYINNINKI